MTNKQNFFAFVQMVTVASKYFAVYFNTPAKSETRNTAMMAYLYFLGQARATLRVLDVEALDEVQRAVYEEISEDYANMRAHFETIANI